MPLRQSRAFLHWAREGASGGCGAAHLLQHGGRHDGEVHEGQQLLHGVKPLTEHGTGPAVAHRCVHGLPGGQAVAPSPPQQDSV